MPEKTLRKHAVPSLKKKNRDYLEVFVEEDGNVIFSHLTAGALPVFEKLARNKNISPNPYCG